MISTLKRESRESREPTVPRQTVTTDKYVGNYLISQTFLQVGSPILCSFDLRLPPNSSPQTDEDGRNEPDVSIHKPKVQSLAHALTGIVSGGKATSITDPRVTDV